MFFFVEYSFLDEKLVEIPSILKSSRFRRDFEGISSKKEEEDNIDHDRGNIIRMLQEGQLVAVIYSYESFELLEEIIIISLYFS